MKTIWKYNIDVGTTSIELPPAHEVVHVGHDPDGELCVWVLHDADPMNVVLPFTFIVYGTGHEIASGLTHVGSVKDEPFMWHVFENQSMKQAVPT